MTQLHSQSDLESALAEFVAAAFSPEEREIAKLRARLAAVKPRSHTRIILQKEICEARLRQLKRELAA